MAIKGVRKRGAERSAAREERRASESASLSAAARSYSAALDMIDAASKTLSRGVSLLAASSTAASSPDLVRYGMSSRLRPAVLEKAVASVVRDLRSRVARARSADVSVPDGTEAAYGLLVSRMSSAADSLAEALEEFGRSVPRSAGRPPPPVRDLILSAASAASHLGRLAGRGRSSASVHVSAVHDEIVSERDVSFY